MKIILTETIDKVGKAGQVINVKDGYARNYLLPQKYAIIATDANLKKIADIEAEAQAKADKRNIEYREMARKINELEAKFEKRAEKDGKLFGSVADVDIIHFLAENDIHVTKSNIIIDSPIKTVGEFQVKIAFTSEIQAQLKITVEASE